MYRRWPALITIAALLVGAGIADRGHGSRQAASGGERQIRSAQVIASPTAVAAPSGALSSTWYCAGGTATRGSAADMSVAIANPGRRALSAEITVVSDGGRSRARVVTAPPRSQVRVLLRTILTARYAAALVEVRGGQVSVDQQVSGPLGFDASPCASGAADRWYFAAGSTLRGADEYLALFNPYPDDTSVDMRFATEQGSRSPRLLQAVPVPGRSLRIVHLNAARVNRHSLLAAQVVARSGRLVVDRLQLFDGRGDAAGAPVGGGSTTAPQGLTLSSGATRAMPTWAFPEGRKAPGAREQIVVSNPSDRDAEVEVGVSLDDPVRNGRLDPLPLSIPSHDVKVLGLSAQDTIPDDVGHSITVRSTNGVPVVAEQTIFGGRPSARTGAVSAFGATLEARTWLFASGDVAPSSIDQLVVQNLSGRRISFRVTVLRSAGTATVRTFAPVELAGLGRTVLRLSRPGQPNAGAVEVRAAAPVVVARALYRTVGPGISISLGVPLPEGARVPQSR